MKHHAAAVVIAISLTFAGAQSPAELKHLTIAPVNSHRPVALTALSIERGVGYPSIITLKGSVEIKTQFCIPAGKKGAVVCEGEFTLRADQAEFHEDTGEIKATGSVSLMPHHRRSANIRAAHKPSH
jgi:hypothetical protein